MKKNDCSRSECPVSTSLDLFGDKWTLLIVRDMLLLNKKSYRDFSESPEKIATNILADRLKRLEEACVITKLQNPLDKKAFIYDLTEKGLELLPIILEVVIWGTKHFPENGTPKEFYKRLKKDRVIVMDEIHECVKQDKSYFHSRGYL